MTPTEQEEVQVALASATHALSSAHGNLKLAMNRIKEQKSTIAELVSALSAANDNLRTVKAANLQMGDFINTHMPIPVWQKQGRVMGLSGINMDGVDEQIGNWADESPGSQN